MATDEGRRNDAEQSEDNEIVNRVTAVVREADRLFERVGGSSRHWARDCFLPLLNKAGLHIALSPAGKRPPESAEYFAVPREQDGPIRIVQEMRSAAYHDRTKDAATRSALYGWSERLEAWCSRESAAESAREAVRPPANEEER